MRDVFVIGGGTTRFGELWGSSIRDLFVEAGLEALSDAGVDAVDGIYVGCMASGLLVGQTHLGALVCDYLGLAPVPAMRVECACASSGMAVRAAFFEVASGASDIVLTGGVEKMTEGADVTAALSSAADAEYEAYAGATFPGLCAMIARAHMHRYGTTREQLASVAVKNHEHGLLNPKAHLRSRITVADVLASPMVADPLRLLDCSPVSDGAAAVVLASEGQAREHHRRTGRPMVRICGVGAATDTIALHGRADLTRLEVVARAARQAYEMAGRSPKDVGVAEVHDGFSIVEILATEALGLVEVGHGGKAALCGETSLGGRIPVNPSGGLKSKGHPVGATGASQVHELLVQLRGEAGARQVRGASLGLAENMGGAGGSATVCLLEVV
jgi:acetyl-CoA C-acetyltransferase